MCPSPFPQPRNFVPAGDVTHVEFSRRVPGFIHPQRGRVKGAKGAGIRYEAIAQKYLDQQFPFYLPSPWLRFKANGSNKNRWCQPDGLNIDIRAGLITIVEIKLKHTEKAWWQTRRLYQPVLEHAFREGSFTFSILEVAGVVDREVRFPERYTFIPRPASQPRETFGVHLYSVRQSRRDSAS